MTFFRAFQGRRKSRRFRCLFWRRSARLWTLLDSYWGPRPSPRRRCIGTVMMFPAQVELLDGELAAALAATPSLCFVFSRRGKMWSRWITTPMTPQEYSVTRSSKLPDPASCARSWSCAA